MPLHRLNNQGFRFGHFKDQHPIVLLIVFVVALRTIDLVVFRLVGIWSDRRLSEILMSWDAAWYAGLGTFGYPAPETVVGADIFVQSSWAWPPVYPFLAESLSRSFELLGFASSSIEITQVGINLISGTAAAVVLYLALKHAIGINSALVFSLLWSSMPAAAVFLMGYTEGLFSLVVFLALFASVRTHYLVAAVLLILAGLVKASVAPFAIALALYVWIQYFRHRADFLALTRVILISVLCTIASLFWYAIVAIRFGKLNALTEVHLAFGRSSTPFLDSFNFLFNFNRPDSIFFFVVSAISVLSVIATVVLLRNRDIPEIFRLSGLMSTVFFFAAGAVIASARMALMNLSFPSLGLALSTSKARFFSLMLFLTFCRCIWIYLYPGGSAGGFAP